jgi:hypothetical protein
MNVELQADFFGRSNGSGPFTEPLVPFFDAVISIQRQLFWWAASSAYLVPVDRFQGLDYRANLITLFHRRTQPRAVESFYTKWVRSEAPAQAREALAVLDYRERADALNAGICGRFIEIIGLSSGQKILFHLSRLRSIMIRQSGGG